MVERQKYNDEEKRQHRAEESGKLESFSHRENDVSGTTSAEIALAMFRRQSRGYARGTFLLAQAIDKTMLCCAHRSKKVSRFTILENVDNDHLQLSWPLRAPIHSSISS
jgi:hypothetical protein